MRLGMAAAQLLKPAPNGALARNGKCFEVVKVRNRGLVEPKKAPSKDAPLALSDVIERVARIKDMARTLKGVGHTHGADAFTEGKDELRRAVERLETDLRRRGVGTNA